MNDLEKIRNDYSQKSLRKEDVKQDPFDQFKIWFDEVLQSDIYEPTACTLSTANKSGKPSGRIVLLKEYSKKGFRFFTNYESRKSLELLANPFASMTFFWKELERQIRVEGKVEKLGSDESEAYFKSRPVGSRIGAWASPQSQVISNRQFLEQEHAKYEAKYDSVVPKPDQWGGFLLIPNQIEFWQGRPSRLHDRILYKNQGHEWKIERLAP